MASKIITNSFRTSGGSVIECTFRHILERASTGKKRKRSNKKKAAADSIQRAVEQHSLKKN